MMTTQQSRRSREQGFSIIEILISLVLGLLLSAGVISLFLSSQRTYNVTERVARMQENGRFALEMLAYELRHGNFWGQLLAAERIEVPAGLITDVESAGLGCFVEDWATDMDNDRFTGGINRTTGLPFSCFATEGIDVDTESSVLAIKRVRPNPADYTTFPAQAWFLRANGAAGEMHKRPDTSTGPDAGQGQQDWLYEPSIYYVSPAGELTLLRSNMNGEMVPQPLIGGIERLHIEYALDTTNNGVPDTYVTEPTTEAVSATVYLLVRDQSGPDPGYTPGTVIFRLGASAGAPVVTRTDQIRRNLFTTTVIAENQRYLPVR